MECTKFVTKVSPDLFPFYEEKMSRATMAIQLQTYKYNVANMINNATWKNVKMVRSKIEVCMDS